MTTCFPPCPVAEAPPFPGALAITGVSPAQAFCTAPNTLVHVKGQMFTDTSVVQLDGVAQTTTFVSPSELTFLAPTATTPTSKTATITVVDGQTTAQGSESFAFTPAPTVTCPLAPDSAVRLGADVPVTVNGSHFTPASVVYLDSVAQPTTMLSPTQLRWTAKASLESTPRTAAVVVKDGPVTTGSCSFAFTANFEEEAPTTRRRRSAE